MSLSSLPKEIWPIPHTPARDCVVLHEFVRRAKPAQVLEFGVAYGKSACFIADAMRDNGVGHVTGLDFDVIHKNCPSPIQSLESCGLSDRATVVASYYSYTWELIEILKASLTDEGYRPKYDFVFIDGAHTWGVDGLAFLLIDKLVRPGGWVLFDDLGWTPDAGRLVPKSKHPRGGDPNVAQVDLIWDLLVLPDKSYGDRFIDGTWGWVQKRPEGGPDDSEQKADLAMLESIYEWVESDPEVQTLVRDRAELRRATGQLMRHALVRFRKNPREFWRKAKATVKRRLGGSG